MKALVLVLTSIFFAPVAILAQPAEGPSCPHKIKILSWNICMLPAFLGCGKMPRAEAIGQLLSDSDYDVIVFQEAFHGKSRRIISRHLLPAFSFQAGPAKHKLFSFRANSGIWIASRHPILYADEITFVTRKGIDGFSRKGALLVELLIEGQRVQIIGTHLQNAGGDWLRHSQCVELSSRLLRPHEEIDVPQVVCGDFNIDRHRNTKSYEYMLQVLDASDGMPSGPLMYSYDKVNNDLRTESGNERDLIDYVLIRQSPKAGLTERRIRVFRHPWRRHSVDLSDHFALEADLVLPAPQTWQRHDSPAVPLPL